MPEIWYDHVHDVFKAIIRRVEKAKIRKTPFPHLVVDDVLPPDVRAGLDRFWPDAEGLGVTNYSKRGEMSLTNIWNDQTEELGRQVWMFARRAMYCVARASRQRLTRYLDEKYRPLFGADWRRVVKDMKYIEPDSMVAHYTGQVYLPPHVDNKRLAVNNFLYLADPAETTADKVRGTMLHRTDGFSWPTNEDIPKAYIERFLEDHTEVEWKDNRLLSYVNGPWSFHSVPPHDLGEGRRRLLMAGTFVPTDAFEKADTARRRT